MSSVGGAPFRNPHNLPVKDCVVCGRPFTWRKKWERCWDEVLTCSNRCKTERRQRKPGGGAQKSEEKPSYDKASATAAVAAAVAAGAVSSAARNLSPASCDEIVEESEMVVQLADEEAASEEETEQDPRELRKSRKAALKAERRARRAQSPQERAAAKRKPCSLCDKAVDLLVRCKIDDTKNWHMLCGRCWREASGGVPDGDAEHPHYRYGGLWKNRSAQVVTPKFVGTKAKEVASDAEAEDEDQQALDAAYKGA